MTELQGQQTDSPRTSGAPPAMRLEHLSKTYPGGATPAVSDLSFDVYTGEVFTLLGPSGCGKSTTLRMVAGLEEPDEGSIYFGERSIVITEKRRRAARGCAVGPGIRAGAAGRAHSARGIGGNFTQGRLGYYRLGSPEADPPGATG